MASISHYSHSLNTKYYAVLLYRNGNPISLCELYGKLRTEKGYSRHACSFTNETKNYKKTIINNYIVTISYCFYYFINFVSHHLQLYIFYSLVNLYILIGYNMLNHILEMV